MKKHLLLALRVLLAIAGLAYIGWSVDWYDKVQSVAPASQPADAPKFKPRVFKVIQGEVNPKLQSSDLVVQEITKVENEPTITISAGDLNDPNKYLLHPSLMTTLKHSNKWLMLLSFVLVAPIYPIQVKRWMILLHARGIEVSFSKAFSLTMIGCFFNYCMPGSTGGDLIKAYYAASRSERRTDAVMSVIFDRVTGLLGLIILGGMVGLLELGQPMVRAITEKVWIGIVLIILGGVVYFSKRARRTLGIDWILARIPAGGIITKIDNAAVSYREHKSAVVNAVLISVPVHLLLCTSTAITGFALGIPMSKFVLVMTTIPVIFLSGALPITPQGAGVWEAIGRALLLDPPYVMMNQIVVMLIMIRVYQLVYSLAGVPFLLKGDIHLHPEKDEEAAAVSVKE